MLWLLGETSLCSSTSPRPAAPPSIACSARKGPRWPTTLRLALTLASTLTLTLTPNPDPDPNPNPNQLVNYLGFQCFAWIFGAFFGAAAWSNKVHCLGSAPARLLRLLRVLLAALDTPMKRPAR